MAVNNPSQSATPSGAAGGVLSGTYPNPGMAAGAASTNVGTVAGDLSGTLPDPTVAQLNGVAASAYALLASPTFSGTTTAPEFSASGLTGATSASRYVGAVASGAPLSGTFAVGDFVIDRTGRALICTVAGTPGTWVSAASLALLIANNLSDLNSASTARTNLGLGSIATTRALTPIAKSISYNVVAGDLVQATGAVTMTLPTPTAGTLVGIISVNGTGANPCTVSTAATIIGPGVAASATSILLGAAGAFVYLIADGTNWNIIAGAQDSGWLTPTLGNSWTAFGGGQTPQYRIQGDTVMLRGQYTPGGSSGTSPFTLPAGYRPAAVTDLVGSQAGVGLGNACLINITTGGVVTISYAATTTGQSQDGGRFTVT